MAIQILLLHSSVPSVVSSPTLNWMLITIVSHFLWQAGNNRQDIEYPIVCRSGPQFALSRKVERTWYQQINLTLNSKASHKTSTKHPNWTIQREPNLSTVKRPTFLWEYQKTQYSKIHRGPIQDCNSNKIPGNTSILSVECLLAKHGPLCARVHTLAGRSGR